MTKPQQQAFIFEAIERLEQCVAALKDEERPWADIQTLLLQAQQSLTLAEFHEPKPAEATSNAEVDLSPGAAETPPPKAEVEAAAEITSSKAMISQTNPGPSLAEKLSEQPLHDLKSSMGINDRVRWASVFSGGDVSSFMELCASLENCSNYESAQIILNEAVPNIDWEDEDFAGFGFLLLVKRLY
ncbi:MAG: hypothetical protein O2818_08710 [Bacteroidetes bacterium]|nr:hypothetical protein [Bacteroidota bacterium]